MKNKKLIIAIVAVVLVAAAMAGIYLAARPAPTAGEKAFTVDVIHADGSTKTFSYTTDADYVGQVLLEEGLIAGEDGEYGLYVLTVDGEDAVYETDGAYWAFYESGDYAMQGVDQTPVQDGGSYGFTYTSD